VQLKSKPVFVMISSEWLVRTSATRIAMFIRERYQRALVRQLSNKAKDVGLGLRMYAIMNSLCVELKSRGLIDDSLICWGNTWMSISFIHHAGDLPYVLRFKFRPSDAG
jgi:hypothetical protein